MNKIFLPVDHFEHSQRAITMAADLAKSSNAEVRVFHFREREPSKAGLVTFETPDDAISLVDQTVDQLKALQVNASGETRVGLIGGIARAIVEEAGEFGADLIVMGSRDLSESVAILIGGATYKVLHLTKCPVLVVP
jgi:nucleotide-binding universal stress UspA family protein